MSPDHSPVNLLQAFYGDDGVSMPRFGQVDSIRAMELHLLQQVTKYNRQQHPTSLTAAECHNALINMTTAMLERNFNMVLTANDQIVIEMATQLDLGPDMVRRYIRAAGEGPEAHAEALRVDQSVRQAAFDRIVHVAMLTSPELIDRHPILQLCRQYSLAHAFEILQHRARDEATIQRVQMLRQLEMSVVKALLAGTSDQDLEALIRLDEVFHRGLEQNEVPSSVYKELDELRDDAASTCSDGKSHLSLTSRATRASGIRCVTVGETIEALVHLHGEHTPAEILRELHARTPPADTMRTALNQMPSRPLSTTRGTEPLPIMPALLAETDNQQCPAGPGHRMNLRKDPKKDVPYTPIDTTLKGDTSGSTWCMPSTDASFNSVVLALQQELGRKATHENAAELFEAVQQAGHHEMLGTARDVM